MQSPSPSRVRSPLASTRVGLLIVLLLVGAASASAQPIFMDLAAGLPTPNSPGNPVTASDIEAGVYDVTFLSMADGGLYEGWNAWGTVTGCDGSGAGCSTGYFVAFACEVPGFGLTSVGAVTTTIWATPELAIANAPTDVSFEAEAGDLVCYILDNLYSDNLGGVSFRLDRRLPTVDVPTVGEVGLWVIGLLLGLAGIAVLRR
ncbi:MAG: hypothetical protein AAGE94_11795 [Acidobacteriota bacterium]